MTTYVCCPTQWSHGREHVITTARTDGLRSAHKRFPFIVNAMLTPDLPSSDFMQNWSVFYTLKYLFYCIVYIFTYVPYSNNLKGKQIVLDFILEKNSISWAYLSMMSSPSTPEYFYQLFAGDFACLLLLLELLLRPTFYRGLRRDWTYALKMCCKIKKKWVAL